MPWVNDLAPGLGIPAGGVTLAVAMYGASVAAEKAARPEALTNIGRILKDPSWSRSVRPSAIIERVFVWTFGERHRSWRCVRRAIIASTIFLMILVTIIEMRTGFFYGAWNWRVTFRHEGRLQAATGMLAFGTIIPFASDYIALAKTRLILRTVTGANSPVLSLLLVPIDIVLSLSKYPGSISMPTKGWPRRIAAIAVCRFPSIP
jgi:hypothetical protein